MSAKSAIAPELLNAKQTAAFLNIGQTAFYELRQKSLIPEPIKLGKRNMWRRTELSDWIAAGCPKRAVWEQVNPMKNFQST